MSQNPQWERLYAATQHLMYARESQLAIDEKDMYLRGKKRTSDLGLRTSGFGLRTSGLRLRTSDFRPHTSDLRVADGHGVELFLGTTTSAPGWSSALALQ